MFKNKKKISLMVLMFTIVLVVAGCGLDKKKHAEVKTQLDEIAVEVDALFNESKDDLAENVDEDALSVIHDELENIQSAEVELSEENKGIYNNLKKEYKLAMDMYNFETLVNELIGEEGKINQTDFTSVKKELETFKEYKTYSERMETRLNAIEKELEKQTTLENQVKETEMAFEKLYTKKGDLKADVSEEEYKEMEKLVKKIDDKELSKTYEKELKKVDKKVKEIAKNKGNKESQTNLADAGKTNNNSNQTSNKNNKSNSNNNKSNSTSNGNKNDNNSSFGSGGKTQSKPKPDPKPQPKPKPEPKPDPKPQPKPKPKPEPKPQPKPEPKPEQPKKEVVLLGELGNSGKEFNNIQDAENWAKKNMFDGENWFDKGYNGWRTGTIFYGYRDSSGKAIEETRKTYTIFFF